MTNTRCNTDYDTLIMAHPLRLSTLASQHAACTLRTRDAEADAMRAALLEHSAWLELSANLRRGAVQDLAGDAARKTSGFSPGYAAAPMEQGPATRNFCPMGGALSRHSRRSVGQDRDPKTVADDQTVVKILSTP